MGVFPFQGKTHMVEPGIEPGTPWLVVRSSDHQATRLIIYDNIKTGMSGDPEVSYHQMYSARDWLSILSTHLSTQNPQRKYRTDLHMTTKARKRTMYPGLQAY